MSRMHDSNDWARRQGEMTVTVGDWEDLQEELEDMKSELNSLRGDVDDLRGEP